MKFIVVALLLFSSICLQAQTLPLVSKIAFGSCASENKPQPILDLVVKHKPDIFVYLGDNIYGDTRDMKVLQAKYDSLAAKPEFQRLKKSIPLFATWDDHDFGENDAGKHYPFKKESKELFLKFFDEPAQSERRKHEGIYTSYLFEGNGRKLQLILLDNRTFRSDLRLYRGELNRQAKYFYPLDYYPHQIKDSILLGEAQWAWLEGELKKPADIRIIGSGSQFSIAFNGYEAWANFPHEQTRLIELLKKTRANGTFFITGHVHYAEISKLKQPGCYPIYDVTSSGITSTWLFATPNENRIEGPVMDNHFGMVSIDWTQKDPRIKMEVWDINDNQRIEHTISLSEISFK
ncbi:alkaline phosphatase family protein [Segetibacter sp. 3557_3]|uniref:alkaline phosphatase D family protein n=1 Tax=Segetibacter sp. 3557_3 TaxID=2547429 RepID=UPI001058A4D7|nr:alkaline phosphatase D family protein [Segetibacter sp. 3557_3]TDH26805.1 alkaline phosphatase family protein [Segetibacter sp. 3557_3]